MLQCEQYLTLNHALHSFFAYSTRNYKYIAKISYFHLTTVSQCDHHASIQSYIEIVLLDQL